MPVVDIYMVENVIKNIYSFLFQNIIYFKNFNIHLSLVYLHNLVNELSPMQFNDNHFESLLSENQRLKTSFNHLLG